MAAALEASKRDSEHASRDAANDEGDARHDAEVLSQASRASIHTSIDDEERRDDAWRRHLEAPEFVADDELRAELERRQLDPSGPRTALLERMGAALGAAMRRAEQRDLNTSHYNAARSLLADELRIIDAEAAARREAEEEAARARREAEEELAKEARRRREAEEARIAVLPTPLRRARRDARRKVGRSSGAPSV